MKYFPKKPCYSVSLSEQNFCPWSARTLLYQFSSLCQNPRPVWVGRDHHTSFHPLPGTGTPSTSPGCSKPCWASSWTLPQPPLQKWGDIWELKAHGSVAENDPIGTVSCLVQHQMWVILKHQKKKKKVESYYQGMCTLIRSLWFFLHIMSFKIRLILFAYLPLMAGFEHPGLEGLPVNSRGRNHMSFRVCAIQTILWFYDYILRAWQVFIPSPFQ